MTILLTAALIGISTACATWLSVFWYQNRRLLAGRLSEVSEGSLSFPYNVFGGAGSSKKSDDITLDSLGHNKVTQDLFLAGLRSQKNIRFFFFLRRLSFIAPIGLLVVYALSGSLNFRNILTAVIVGVVIFVYVHLTVRILKQRRQNRILRALPQLLDLIVVCVEAGLSFTSALERILKEVDLKEPLTQEFSLMYHEFLGGLPLAQACERMDKRCGVPDLSLLLSAIVQSDQIGASLGNNLRTQAIELRDKLRQRVRTRAFQVPVKILFPMMLIFLGFVILNLGYIGYQLGAVVGGQSLGKSSRHSQSGASIKSQRYGTTATRY